MQLLTFTTMTTVQNSEVMTETFNGDHVLAKKTFSTHTCGAGGDSVLVYVT